MLPLRGHSRLDEMNTTLETTVKVALTASTSENLSLDDHLLTAKGLRSLEGLVGRRSSHEAGDGYAVLLEL